MTQGCCPLRGPASLGDRQTQQRGCLSRTLGILGDQGRSITKRCT